MPADPLPHLESALAHAQFVRAVARGVLGGDRDVEDVLQETFLVAGAQAPRRPGALRAWLGTVARRLALDRRRAEGRRSRREQAAARTETVPDVADLLVREETRRRLVEAVARLDEPYRSTMLWRYHAGKSVAEIATLLAVPIDTVRTRLQRALARLREDLDARHGGERKAWAIALVPLVEGGPGVALAGTIAGGLAVKKTLVAALVLLALAGGAWEIARDPAGLPTAPVRSRPEAVALAGAPSHATTQPPAPALAARDARADGAARGHAGPRAAFSGVVVGPEGRPIAGAEVAPYGFVAGDAAGPTPPSIRESAAAGTRATTATDGRFVLDLPGVSDSPFDVAVIVRVTASEFAPRTGYVRRDEDARVVLARGGAAGVRVTDERGRPVAGASATWYGGEAPLAADPRDALPAPSGSATTADDGRGSARLAAGTYRVRVAAQGLRPVDSEPVALAEGGAIETALRLDEGIVAQFTVLDEAGAPVVGATVRTEGPRRSGGTATTDAEGTCRIAGHGLPGSGEVPAAGFRGEILTFVAEAERFVASDGFRRLAPAVGPLAIEVRLVRGVRVRVHVTDAEGRPIPTASARWIAPADHRPWLEPSNDAGSPSIDGWLVLPRVRPGPARIALRAEPEGTYESTSREATIGPEGGDLTMTLARIDGALTLQVLRADATPAFPFDVAFEPTDVAGALVPPSASGFTDRGGRVRLERLRCGPGRVVVRARGQAEQRFAMEATPSPSSEPRVVRLRPTRPLAGRVQTRDARPVPDLGLDLYEREAGDAHAADPVAQVLVAQTRTDAEGRFRFEVDGDRAYGLAVPGGAWLAVGESVGATAMPGTEDVVLRVKPASEGWGLPVRIRATSAGRPYAGRLQLATTAAGGLTFAMELGHDPDGIHRFGIPGAPGRFDLTLYAPGHRPTTVNGVSLEETPEGTMLDVALDRGAVVRVRVLDGDGRPRARTWVTLNGGDPVETDDAGECECGGWPPTSKPFSFPVALASDAEYTAARTPGVAAPGSTTVVLRRRAIVHVALGLPGRALTADVAIRVLDPAGREVDARTIPAAEAASWPSDAAVECAAYADGPHRIEVTMGDCRGEATVEAVVGRRAEVRVVWR